MNPTLEEVLANTIWFGKFMEFCSGEFNNECLYFIKVVEKLEGGNFLYKRYKASRVVDKYIRASGSREVNIEHSLRIKLLDPNEDVVKTLVEAKRAIITLVRADSFQRFLHSSFAKEALQLVTSANARKEMILNSLSEAGLV